MDIIHLLPDSVANQIAAGEVIQRPASCIKELVENSLDAGATNIQIILYDAGRTMIQVIDNGKGMSETDARMAFERHATSKIASAQDLFSLHTMGFRGEALASICAVAQVELQTRRPEDEIGTRLLVNGSDIELQEPCVCPAGTNFKVKNLFYNVPARRRFLKTDTTELRNILQEFYRMVLVNPDCQFTLVSQDEILQELPIGTTKQRIEQVFGKSLNKQFTASLVEIKSDTELVSIRGFVGKPEFSGKNAQQYFFVNNRYMRHPYFHKAVLTAYQGMLAADHQPSYFIYFDINPEMIDVNIHPTKTEIKFADEQAIWQILLASVREALGKFNVVPSLDFESEETLEIPMAPTDLSEVKRPEINFDPTYNPFQSHSSYSPWQGTQGKVSASSKVEAWESLYSVTETVPAKEEEAPVLFEEPIASLHPYQVANRWIMVPAKDGLLLVDQCRAHLSVLFEEMRQTLKDHRGVTQQLLFPEVLELSPDEMQLVKEAYEDLVWVGFELDQLSPNAWSISGVPATLGNANALEALRSILFSIGEAGVPMKDTWRDKIALSLAETTAIRPGRVLSEAEMRDLLERLFALDQHSKTPTGKTIMNKLQLSELEKLF